MLHLVVHVSYYSKPSAAAENKDTDWLRQVFPYWWWYYQDITHANEEKINCDITHNTVEAINGGFKA